MEQGATFAPCVMLFILDFFWLQPKCVSEGSLVMYNLVVYLFLLAAKGNAAE